VSGLTSVTVDARHRARRWDAIVVGSGVAARMAAARVAQQGQRVLLVREASAARRPDALHEPFFLAGALAGGVLERALRKLKLPLIDRRRIRPEALAYQVVGPGLRCDVGEAAWTASELVAWGLAKPDEAQAICCGLLEATEAELAQMLAAPLVGAGRRRSRGRTPARELRRGLPAEVARAGAALGRVFAAQVRALGNHALRSPGSEACARLLGAVLAGGAGVEAGSPGLLAMLCRRFEALYGEVRNVEGRIDLVHAGAEPGIAVEKTGELWLGRALVLAAPASRLAPQLVSAGAQRLVLRDAPAATARRIAGLWNAPRTALPEGMARRLVLLGGDPAADPQAGVITLALHARGPASPQVEIVGRTLALPGEGTPDALARIEARLSALLPFAGPALQRQAEPTPLWDDDDWLEDGPSGTGWPGEARLRVPGRAPVYRLDRAAVASLGLEGDLLLGWRAGDAVAAELA